MKNFDTDRIFRWAQDKAAERIRKAKEARQEKGAKDSGETADDAEASAEDSDDDGDDESDDLDLDLDLGGDDDSDDLDLDLDLDLGGDDASGDLDLDLDLDLGDDSSGGGDDPLADLDLDLDLGDDTSGDDDPLADLELDVGDDASGGDDDPLAGLDLGDDASGGDDDDPLADLDLDLGDDASGEDDDPLAALDLGLDDTDDDDLPEPAGEAPKDPGRLQAEAPPAADFDYDETKFDAAADSGGGVAWNTYGSVRPPEPPPPPAEPSYADDTPYGDGGDESPFASFGYPTEDESPASELDPGEVSWKAYGTEPSAPPERPREDALWGEYGEAYGAPLDAPPSPPEPPEPDPAPPQPTPEPPAARPVDDDTLDEIDIERIGLESASTDDDPLAGFDLDDTSEGPPEAAPAATTNVPPPDLGGYGELPADPPAPPEPLPDSDPEIGAAPDPPESELSIDDTRALEPPPSEVATAPSIDLPEADTDDDDPLAGLDLELDTDDDEATDDDDDDPLAGLDLELDTDGDVATDDDDTDEPLAGLDLDEDSEAPSVPSAPVDSIEDQLARMRASLLDRIDPGEDEASDEPSGEGAAPPADPVGDEPAEAADDDPLADLDLDAETDDDDALAGLDLDLDEDDADTDDDVDDDPLAGLDLDADDDAGSDADGGGLEDVRAEAGSPPVTEGSDSAGEEGSGAHDAETLERVRRMQQEMMRKLRRQDEDAD